LIYFKACFNRPPPEAALTQALARKWPNHIPQPLVIDEEKNWMLLRDYRGPTQISLQFSDYPKIARILAEIQVESLESMDEWQRLTCPLQGLDQLQSFLGNIKSLSEVLMEGGRIALSSEEIDRLGQMTGRLQTACGRLSEYAVPNTLVHPDVWITSLISKDGEFLISDWSGTVVSHPFFGIQKLIQFRDLLSKSQSALHADVEADGLLIERILDAYLEAFTRFEKKDRLTDAMSLARELHGAWRLLNWSQAIAYEEHESVSYQRVARHLQVIAREMIEKTA